MTTASELKCAAVVEVEVKRKTSETRRVKVVSRTAVEHAGASFKSGSTTAAATKKVAKKKVAKKKVATSGSRAATTIRAASIRATSLPVSIFPPISRFSPTPPQGGTGPQLNPIPLWQCLPEGLLRASRAS